MSTRVCEKIQLNKDIFCLSTLPYICEDYLYFKLIPENNDIELMKDEAEKALNELKIKKEIDDTFILQQMIELPVNNCIETTAQWIECCVQVAKVKVK